MTLSWYLYQKQFGYRGREERYTIKIKWQKNQLLLLLIYLPPIPSNIWWFILLSVSATKNKKTIHYQDDEEENNLGFHFNPNLINSERKKGK